METLTTITTKKAAELIDNCTGFYRVEFVKKDGTLREMTCKNQVQKHLKGGELQYKPAEHGLKCVYDMQAKGYRMINLKSLVALRIDGIEYGIK